MLHNYLLTALRNLTRHRLYSFINIAGLAVGLACAIFIVLFIRDELSFDRWVPGADRLYRVESSYAFPGRPVDNFASVTFPLSAAMKAHIPAVQAQTRIAPEKQTVKADGRLFPETTNAVDPDFFSVLRLPLIAGDPSIVFAEPESVVLSQSTARKYFGRANAMGRTITIGDGHVLKVTGIMRDLPHNTHLRIDLAFADTSKADANLASDKASWVEPGVYAYVRLAAGADPATVLKAFRPVIDANVNVRPLRLTGSQLITVHLTPFADVHLRPEKLNAMAPSGSWTTIYGFAAIACLILAAAGFNFTNLATVRAMTRAREVSMRKVVGAKRRQLVVQFLGESVVMGLIAVVLALALVEILLPAFDGFLGRPLGYSTIGDWPLTLGVCTTAALVGLLGGLYPAFVLSAFRPAAALGALQPTGIGAGGLRTALVVLQFAISIGLAVATVVVFEQISYAQRIDLGFDRENVIVLEGADKLTQAKRDSMVQALAADPAIEGAAELGAYPFSGQVNIASARPEGAAKTSILRVLDIGFGVSNLYRMHLLAGRALSQSHAQDANPATELSGFRNGCNIVINEAAARYLGFTAAAAVGKVLIVGGSHMHIVGVLANANVDGVQTAVPPIIFYNNPNSIESISVRARPGRDVQALAAVDRIWHRFVPGLAIERHFLDDSFDRLFATDERQGRMFGVFVGIAVFIACLGLFGLAAYSAERRTAEIGVRKVFGARTGDVVRLLLWQFSIPVLIANVIAWPVSWYWLHNWLEGYAYRIQLSPVYFLAAGAAALAIAWLTVIGHSLAVARANPVHALRYE